MPFKKNQKKPMLLVLSVLGFATVGAAAFSHASSVNLTAQEGEHAWNHYAAVTPTETSDGNKEYWICCDCKDVSFVAPEEGVVTDVDNPNFGSVREGKEENAAYLSAVQNNTWNIGYQKVAKVGAGENVVAHVDGFDDVVEAVDASSIAKGSFGNNAYAKSPNVNEGNSNTTAGALMFYLGKNEGDRQIELPRFNYNLYEYVTFEYGIDTWNAGSLAASFGVSSSTDLRNNSTAKYGSIRVSLVEGELVVTSTIGTSVTSVKVTDQGVIDGAKSLTLLGASVDGDRTFYLNKINVKSLNHVHNFAEKTQAADRYGRASVDCGCGEQKFVAGDNIDAFPNPNIYGCSGSYMTKSKIGAYNQVITDGTPGYICLALGNDGKTTSMSLPKIDFKTSGSTVIRFGTNSGGVSNENLRCKLTYGGVTLLDKENHGDQASVSFFVNYDEKTGNATLSSVISDGTVSEVATISDQSVINGEKSLSLTVDCVKNYFTMGLYQILCGHTHSTTSVAAGDHIEFAYDYCADCGYTAKTSQLASSLTSFASTASFGMNASFLYTEATGYGKVGSVRFPGSKDMNLPKVNYSAFSSVVLDLAGDSFNMDQYWFNVKIGDEYLFGDAETHNKAPRFKLTITATEAGHITLTAKTRVGESDAETLTKTLEFDDVNIATGKSSLVLTPVNDSGRSIILRAVNLTA